MSRTLLPASLAAALIGGSALAQAPSVAVDIAPVHSLVARVMQGVGTPDLIVQPGASPHQYALRPSEARGLQEADLVFWVSAGLTPWLDGAIETLAADASVTELLESDGTVTLDFREGALFEKHVHSGEAHDDHAEEEHDDHTEHDDHAGHDHDKHDPHAWLSPQNASNWMNVVAAQLSAADPENAGIYFANAAAGRVEIATMITEVNTMLEPLRGNRFIVFHDAYQYFETDFDFPAAGAISISDASDPSPARIAEIRERIAAEDINCVLAEPQFNPGLAATVLDGSNADTAVIDPMGSDLEIGPALYLQLIRNLATSLAKCL
ncbi:zinc ABC transporter substrate-binding protein [Puniceibacterium sp. IMCC21224]|uniref:zinc ABC transporter substrate-binding protein n=1 Tax=Puniceibacterium sp. IMCC21224 TaxID=1618204 RepID=UPI00064D9DD2|nr:zinc ABC transporter substrate-binding protein [Puniceibacterium sp. IMCC21224]